MKDILPVRVVGGGLAGSEAAYFLARNGIPVTLSPLRFALSPCLPLW